MKKIRKLYVAAGIAILLLVLGGVGFWYRGRDTEIPPVVAAQSAMNVPKADRENLTKIALKQQESEITGAGAKSDGQKVTVTKGGTYLVSGTLEEGQILIDAGEKDTVILLMQDVGLTNSAGPVIQADRVGHLSIQLEKDSENMFQSGEEIEVTKAEADEDATGAAIYSHGDLSVTGEGSCRILGYLNNGIQAKGNLLVHSGELTIEAHNHAVKGKDSVEAAGGKVSILSGGDGIKSDNTAGGEYGNILITAGDFSISSGDDGIHADEGLSVSGGTIKVIKSYEGLEGNQITIDKADIEVTAADDGFNAYGGQNSMGGGSAKKTEEMPNLEISGGNLVINADGDGLDSNGDLSITGGSIVVNGPENSGNGAIDAGSENGGSCTISGGTIIALGSAGMAEGFTEESKQYSFLHNFSTSFGKGSKIVIKDGDGKKLYQYTAEKNGSSIVFSCPELEKGKTYVVSVDGQEEEITMDSVAVSNGSSRGGFGRGERNGFR